MPLTESQPARRWDDFKVAMKNAWPGVERNSDDPHRRMANLMECFGSSLDFTQCIKIEYMVPANQTLLDDELLNSLLKVGLPKKVELRCLQDGIRKTVEIDSPLELDLDSSPCEYSVETLVFEVYFTYHR